MRARNAVPGWSRIRLIILVFCAAQALLASSSGGVAPAASVDGLVRSTSGGFRFPDGTVLESAAGSYAGVVVVAKSGGHFSSVQAALDSIVDASASNRYLVRVGPGIYIEQVAMKPFVDIEGSGELVTKITFFGFTTLDEATLTGANDAELRFLTVESFDGPHPVAILNASVSPRIRHVTASVIGGLESAAVRNTLGAAPELVHMRAIAQLGTITKGIVNVGASPKLSHVDARAFLSTFGTTAISHTGGGTMEMIDVRARAQRALRVIESSLSMEGGSLLAEGAGATALFASLSTVKLRGVRLLAVSSTWAKALNSLDAGVWLRNCVLEAEGASLSEALGTTTGTAFSAIRVAKSQLIGVVSVPVAEIVCVGAYDDNLAALNKDCL